MKFLNQDKIISVINSEGYVKTNKHNISHKILEFRHIGKKMHLIPGDTFNLTNQFGQTLFSKYITSEESISHFAYTSSGGTNPIFYYDVGDENLKNDLVKKGYEDCTK